MPPSFMVRISRSSCALVTAAPNHHQRIMGRALFGGCSNPRRSSCNSRCRVCAENAGMRCLRVAQSTGKIPLKCLQRRRIASRRLLSLTVCIQSSDDTNQPKKPANSNPMGRWPAGSMLSSRGMALEGCEG
jgi:hypothetical protein